MITFVKNDDMSMFLSSTRGLGDDFKFIGTDHSNNNTIETSISVEDRTVRYDRFAISSSVIDNDYRVGFYDFVVVDSEFTGSYNTTTDIVVDYPQAVIEVGKLRVRPSSENPIITYIPSTEESPTINDYEPENL